MQRNLSFLNFSDDDERRTVSHALDLAYRAYDTDICVSAFLNVREQKLVKTALESDGSFSFSFFGGFPGAERRTLICFPEYLMYSAGIEYGCNEADFCGEYAADFIKLLHISCSRFSSLSHRDYMGAILGLGIERSSIGDIIVNSEHDAYVFVLAKIADFLKGELKTAGRAPVNVSETPLSYAPSLKHSTHEFDAVSSSLRLDCVISALTGMSREKSKSIINSGMAELNYYSKASCDDTVSEGDIISVRGCGKFKIARTDERTSKGKYRLKAEKYI